MAKRRKASRKRPTRPPSARSPFAGFAADTAESHAVVGGLADDVAKAEASYRAGVAPGERDLGATSIERHAGRLAQELKARGYLLCRRGLVQCLVATGRHIEALAECEALARLDAEDQITARFMHLDILMTLRRFDAARRLIARHADEPYSRRNYFLALVEFADGGDFAESRRLLAKAKTSRSRAWWRAGSSCRQPLEPTGHYRPGCSSWI